MKVIKVGAGVLNQTPLDWQGNERRIVETIDQARAEGVSLLCLPEMCITGYGCEDSFHAPNTCERALQMLDRLVAKTEGMIVSFGLPIIYNNGVYNAAALAVDGTLVDFVGKQSLAGDGITLLVSSCRPHRE